MIGRKDKGPSPEAVRAARASAQRRVRDVIRDLKERADEPPAEGDTVPPAGRFRREGTAWTPQRLDETQLRYGGDLALNGVDSAAPQPAPEKPKQLRGLV